MRHPLRLLTCAAVFLGSGLVIAGDDHHGLDRAYARLIAGIKSKDLKATHAMLAPGFTWVEASGRVMNRAEFIAMDTARTKTPGLTFHDVSMKNDSYDFMGDEARVRSTTTVVLSYLEHGKRMKIRSVSETVDTWRKGPRGQWLAYKVETTSETFEPIR